MEGSNPHSLTVRRKELNLLGHTLGYSALHGSLHAYDWISATLAILSLWAASGRTTTALLGPFSSFKYIHHVVIVICDKRRCGTVIARPFRAIHKRPIDAAVAATPQGKESAAKTETDSGGREGAVGYTSRFQSMQWPSNNGSHVSVICPVTCRHP